MRTLIRRSGPWLGSVLLVATMLMAASSPASATVRGTCKGIGGTKVASGWLTLYTHYKVFVNRRAGRVCAVLRDSGDSGYQTIKYKWRTYDGICRDTWHTETVSRHLTGTVALWHTLGTDGRFTVSSRGVSRTISAGKRSSIC